MFPLLFAAKALGKISPFGKSLDGKPVKDTTTEASAEKDAETAASAKTNAVMQNVSNTTDTDKPEEEKEMFGGMDLGKIKSALDEDSPIGMPSEVKGGVYKQIFEVNKMMLGSLQRIESTMKLLLGLEYERAVGFQQQERDENLTEGDTDDKGGEKGPGRFGRGLSAAGDMLGGAYSKAKGFASGSLAKLLGLGVLIFAFNKYREEIIGAMAGILEYFNDVYDVFKSDGIGAAFDKVVDDFKNIFFPKIRAVGISVLEFVWGAIKSTAKEFFLGAQGDKAIREERKSLTSNKAALGTLAETLDFDKIRSGPGKGGISLIGGKFALTRPAQSRLGLERDSAEALAMDTELNSIITSMERLTRESDYRIQFKGLPDMTKKQEIKNRFDDGTLSIDKLLNTVPIIDGIESTFKDLNAFGLYESAGITKEMDEVTREAITENLAKASELTRLLNDPNTKRKDGKFNIGGRFFGKEFVTDAEAKTLVNSLKADNLTLGAFTSSVFDAEESMFGDFKTEGDTQSTKSLNGIEITGTNRTSSPSANFNPVTVNNVDNKKIIDAKEINYHDLQSQNINFTVRQLAKYANGDAVFGL